MIRRIANDGPSTLNAINIIRLKRRRLFHHDYVAGVEDVGFAKIECDAAGTGCSAGWRGDFKRHRLPANHRVCLPKLEHFA